MKLIFATNNHHKIEEIQAAIGNKIEVISLLQANINIEIPEPYDTLEENASEKSTTIHKLTEPGVKSARYAGEDKAFDKNIEKLLTKLGSNSNRNARFRTVISLIFENKEYFFEGICNGIIATGSKGSKGFGYDPVFIPLGSDRSFAEMTMDEKNKYSHRKKAADKLVLFLSEQG